MTLSAQIESLSRQANWDNPALHPYLSTDLLNNVDMLLMRHKMKYPQWMPDEERLKLIIAEMQTGGQS